MGRESRATADWKPLKLDRTWDTRWDARESEEAICRADDQAERAKANLGRAIQCVTEASEQYASALSWCSSARTFGAKHLPVIPEVFSTDDGYCSSCGEPLPTEEMLARPCPQRDEVDCLEDTHDA